MRQNGCQKAAALAGDDFGVADRLAGRPESVFRRATAMFGLSQAQATLDWIDQIRPLLLERCCADTDQC